MGGMGGFAPVAHLSWRALYEARDCAAPAGAKGLLVDSMCQIGLRESAGQVDLRDLGAALAAQAGLGAPVALGVDRMPGGVGGGFDQRPAQVFGPVLGQWAAVVFCRRTGRRVGTARCSRRVWWGWGSG